MNVIRGSNTTALMLFTATLLAGTPASAWFQASDIIVVPVAAHTSGEEGSNWGTDLYITNVNTVLIQNEENEEYVRVGVPVDVCIYFMPSGGSNNLPYLNRQDYGLGGRESESFHFVDERLANIPPFGTVVLEKPLQLWWDEISSLADSGAFIIFAYTPGSLDDRDTYPEGSEPGDIVVNSRTYNMTTIFVEDEDNEGEYLEKDVTYGQTIPGVPWYNLADGGYTDLAYQYLNGGVISEAHRYNVGIFNASDPHTTLLMEIEVLQPNGEPYTDDNGDPLAEHFSLPPLSHYQYNRFLHTMGLEDENGVLLKVNMVGWTSMNDDPRPMFTSYGSVIDYHGNDPTTILPTFSIPYNVDCMWQNEEEEKARENPWRHRLRTGRRPFQAP